MPFSYDSYPRPPADNGRGVHWSPSQYAWGRDNWDHWRQLILDLGLKWIKVNVPPDYNAEALVKRLVDIEVMPVLRYITKNKPGATGGYVGGNILASIERCVRSGARYVEFMNEPDADVEWVGNRRPKGWEVQVCRNFIADAKRVIAAGGYPGFYGFNSGPSEKRNPIQILLSLPSGKEVLQSGRTWIAIHNYGKGRPINYPNDRVRMFGKPLPQSSYLNREKLGIPDHWGDEDIVQRVWRGKTLDQINTERKRQANPNITIMTDPTGFRAFEHWHGLCVAEGIQTPPVMMTEGGWETDDGIDLGGGVEEFIYPKATAYGASLLNARILDWIQGRALLDIYELGGTSRKVGPPDYLFALMPWHIGERAFGFDTSGQWEQGAWVTDWHNERYELNGELPVIDMLKSLPHVMRHAGNPPAEWATYPRIPDGVDYWDHRLSYLPKPIYVERSQPDNKALDIAGYKIWRLKEAYFQDKNEVNPYYALPPGYVCCIVKDENNKPIQGADVRIARGAAIDYVGTKGSEDGYKSNYFMHGGLGTYRVSIQGGGYFSDAVVNIGRGGEGPGSEWDLTSMLFIFQLEAVKEVDKPEPQPPVIEPVPVPEPPNPLPGPVDRPYPVPTHNHKFGFHINGWSQAVIDTAIRMQPHIVKVLDPNVDNLRILREQIPGVFIIGRLVGDQTLGPNVASSTEEGEIFADLVLSQEANDHGLIDAWESYNEVVHSRNHEVVHRQYDAFQVAFGEKIKAAGMHPIALNFATGNGYPDVPIEWYEGTFETYDLIGCHEYDWPTMSRLHLQGRADGNDGMWLALRYRRLLNALKPHYGNRHKIIVTECGMTQGVVGGQDIGYLATQNTTSLKVGTPLQLQDYFFSLVRWYGGELMIDPDVLGACLFVTGASGRPEWETFEHLGPFMDRLKSYQDSDSGSQKPTPPVVQPPKDETDDRRSYMTWNQEFNQSAIDYYDNTGEPLDGVTLRVFELNSHYPEWEFTIPSVSRVPPGLLVEGQNYLRCIGFHLLTADQNQNNHNAYFDVIGPDGKRIRGTKLPWGWAGMSVDEMQNTAPVIIEKPDTEPGGNAPMHWGMSVIAPHDDAVDVPGFGPLHCDVITGLNSRFPNDPASPRGKNDQGHWSMYTVYQVRPWVETEPPTPAPPKTGVIVIEGDVVLIGTELPRDELIKSLPDEWIIEEAKTRGLEL